MPTSDTDVGHEKQDALSQKSRRERGFLRSKLIKFLVLTLPALLSALLLGEIAFRLFRLAPAIHAIRAGAEQSAYQLSNNPLLVYELKANYRDENPDYFDRLPSTNSHGQRDRERQWAKPPNVTRILVLGDSVTVGDGIRDLNDTIPRQLEQLLAEQQVEVLNMGVTGYCTASEVELLKTKGLKYSPDLVVVLFVENDFQHTAIGVKAEALDDADRSPTRRPAVVEQLFVYSHLFRFTSLCTNLYGFRDQFQPPELTEIVSVDGFDRNVEEGLSRLTGLANTHGFKTVIAIWPAFNYDAIVDRPAFQDAPDKLVIEGVAERVGIPTFRLSRHIKKHYLDALRREQGRCPNPYDFYTIDGMHPNPTGARVASEAIAEALAAHPEWLEPVVTGGSLSSPSLNQ